MGTRILALSLFLLVGCGETKTVPQAGPVTVPSVPEATVVAHLASFRSGVGAVAVITDGKAQEIFPASNDVVLRRGKTPRTFFAIDRRHGAVYRHDLSSTQLMPPIYRDRGANIQDVLELRDGSMWVSALNRESIVRVGGSGKVLETVSLKELAAPTAKGLAYPTFFWASAERTFLLVQRLKDGVRPSEESYVIELAATKGIVGSSRKLFATNPYTDWVPDGLGCAYVGEAGEVGMFSKMDGAVERFCPTAKEPWSTVVTEATLKRDIYDFALLKDGKVLFLSTAPKNELFVFDAARGVVEEPLISVPGFRFVDLVSDGSEQVYVADRSETAPGIRAVDVGQRTLAPVMKTSLEPMSLLWMQ